jgi:hypothetical protein
MFLQYFANGIIFIQTLHGYVISICIVSSAIATSRAIIISRSKKIVSSNFALYARSLQYLACQTQSLLIGSF